MCDHRKAVFGMITFLEHTMELHLQTRVSDNCQEDGCYEMELENILFHLFTETVLYPWVASNWLCRPGWPWVYSDPPASASQARELQVHATTPCSFSSHSASLEKKNLFGLTVTDRVSSWIVEHRYGTTSRETYILNYKQRANSKWQEALNSQRPPLVAYLLLQ